MDDHNMNDYIKQMFLTFKKSIEMSKGKNINKEFKEKLLA